MPNRIYVNLPVADVGKSRSFYEALGFANEPMFTNEQSAGMRWCDEIYVMLLSHEAWKNFTSKDIPDASGSAQVMLALALENREAVDAMTEAAAAHGGSPDCNPKQDHGFMYGRSFEDPDGHIWEPGWMDMDAFAKMAAEAD